MPVAKTAAVAKIGLAPLTSFCKGIKIMFPLTPPKQLTFLISVVLAVAAVVVRYLVYTGVEMPAFPTGGSCSYYSAIWCSLPETCLKERRP